jgi:hypothetical protein
MIWLGTWDNFNYISSKLARTSQAYSRKHVVSMTLQVEFYLFRNSVPEFGAPWAHVREGGEDRSGRPRSTLHQAAVHQSQDLWHPRIKRHEISVSSNMYVLSRLTEDFCAQVKLWSFVITFSGYRELSCVCCTNIIRFSCHSESD